MTPWLQDWGRVPTVKLQKHGFPACHLYTSKLETKGQVLLARWNLSQEPIQHNNITYKRRKASKQVSKIDANTRDFEAELQAQNEQNLQSQAELHPDTEVVTATAL